MEKRDGETQAKWLQRYNKYTRNITRKVGNGVFKQHGTRGIQFHEENLKLAK
jgi:hypothetical protein